METPRIGPYLDETNDEFKNLEDHLTADDIEALERIKVNVMKIIAQTPQEKLKCSETIDEI